MNKVNLFDRSLWFFLAVLLVIAGCSGEGIPERGFTISGYVFTNIIDPSGVEMTLSGDADMTATTDQDGKYTFSGLPNGDYTITPYRKGYDFSPESQGVKVEDANVEEINFYGTEQEDPVGDYSISGMVLQSVGGGLANVTLNLSGTAHRTTTTDESGNYVFIDRADGNYTVTPSLANYAFTPFSRDVAVSGENEVVGDFTATRIPTSTYTQSDLTGTWRVTVIKSDGWARFVSRVDNEGNTVNDSYEDSEETAGPDFENSVSIIDADGVVNGLMTMAADKTMLAGLNNGLIIALKARDAYDVSDLNNTAFVYHLLKVGAVNEWRHGTGTIGADRTMNIASETHSGGAPVTGPVGQIAVSSEGVVTLDTHSTFKGFLSYDKKTVVATETVGDSYVVWVVQITGKAYTAGSLPDSVANVYMLAGGIEPAPLSAHWTATTFGGTTVASNWDNNNFSAPDPCDPLVDASGVVSIPGDANHGATHGQLSDDEKFIVGTKTLSSEGSPFGYAMVVYTIK